MRKFLFVMLLLCSVFSKPAGAFVQFVPALVTSGGTISMAATAEWLLSIIGAVGLWVTLDDYLDTKDVRVPVANGAPYAVPAPSASGTTSTVPMYSCAGGQFGASPHCTSGGNPYLFSTRALACAATKTQVGPAYTGSYVDGSNHCHLTASGGVDSDFGVFSSGGTVCPAGYTYSSGTCNLSDARAVLPTDGSCDVARSGTTLTFITDPDCSAGGAIKGVIGSGYYTVGGIDADGNPIEVKVTPLSGGGSEITVSRQQVDPAGKSVVQKDTVKVNPSGVVTEAKRDTQTGSVALDPATQTATPSTQASSEFPTDYAREVTLGAAVTALNTVHTDLTSTSATPPSDPSVRPTTDISGLMPDSTFTGLKGWSMPSRSVSCPTWTFDAFGGTQVMDAHCTLWADASVGAVVQACMLLVWALIALFLVMGA